MEGCSIALGWQPQNIGPQSCCRPYVVTEFYHRHLLRKTNQERIQRVSTLEEEQKGGLYETEQDCPLLTNEILPVPETSTNTAQK